MDDTNESELLYEACAILMRFSARSFKGIRADIDQIELPNLLVVEEQDLPEETGSTSYSFVPLMLTLFCLGLLAIVVRNERVQIWGLLLSRNLRRWLRKLKTTFTRMAVNLGPVRKSDLLNMHMRSPGNTWELRSNTGQSACFAVQGRRPKMEDRFTLVEKLGGTPLHLFAVYDGHGGEFAADYAQRWIVNWLEKRSESYKTKPQTPKRTTPPSSINQHEIRIEEPAPDGTDDRPDAQLPKSPASRRSSLTQLQEPSSQSEQSKTPAVKRRSLGGDGLQPPSDQMNVNRGEIASIRRGSVTSVATERRGSLTNNTTERKGSVTNSATGRRGSCTNMTRTPSGSSSSRPVPTPLAKRQSIKSDSDWDLSHELTIAIMESDKALISEAKKRNDVAGSTALVAILDSVNSQLAVANVGDSRGILCDAKGTVIPLSFDHKPQQLKERKRIQEAGGFISFNGVWRVAGILATSRALGDFPLKDRKLLIAEPDVLSFDLHDLRLVQPSFLILASDGLWDAFTNEEAALYVRQRLNEPYLGAKSLAMQAYQRGSVDNITVLVINLSKL